MGPVTDLPNVGGRLRVAARRERTVEKRPASAREPCSATQNFDTRRGHGSQDPRSSTLAGNLEPSGGRSGSKWNSVGGLVQGTRQTRFTALQFDSRHHAEKHFADRTPLGTRDGTRFRIGGTDTHGHDGTSFPDSTLRDVRGTKPTRRRLRQKTGTLTRRYGTQLHYCRHFQGGESRRNTGEQLDTCDSPCLEERCTDDALRCDRPTGGGGLRQVRTQLRRKLGR